MRPINIAGVKYPTALRFVTAAVPCTRWPKTFVVVTEKNIDLRRVSERQVFGRCQILKVTVKRLFTTRAADMLSGDTKHIGLLNAATGEVMQNHQQQRA